MNEKRLLNRFMVKTSSDCTRKADKKLKNNNLYLYSETGHSEIILDAKTEVRKEDESV